MFEFIIMSSCKKYRNINIWPLKYWYLVPQYRYTSIAITNRNHQKPQETQWLYNIIVNDTISILFGQKRFAVEDHWRCIRGPQVILRPSNVLLSDGAHRNDRGKVTLHSGIYLKQPSGVHVQRIFSQLLTWSGISL